MTPPESGQTSSPVVGAEPTLPRGKSPSSHPRAPSRPVDLAMVLWMIGLTAIWGVNAVSIKVVTRGVAPVMAGAIRGAIAWVLIALLGWWRGESQRFSPRQILQGSVAGLIIAMEAVFLYHGARYTNGGHIAIFINMAPFFVAGGAHFLLPDEKMHLLKAAGLVLAFLGVVALFSDQLNVGKAGFWFGDSMVIVAASLWACSTLYIKVYLGGRFTPIRLMNIRILSSTLMLLAASWLTEPEPFFAPGWIEWSVLVFQGGVVVCFSYMMWVVLLNRYPATALQPFSFLTPIWGVVTGVIWLGEEVSPALIGGMALVGAGLFLVNRPPLAPKTVG